MRDFMLNRRGTTVIKQQLRCSAMDKEHTLHLRTEGGSLGAKLVFVLPSFRTGYVPA